MFYEIGPLPLLAIILCFKDAIFKDTKQIFLKFEFRLQQGILTEGISTVDLLVLTSSDQLLFILTMFFLYFTKQPILMRGTTIPRNPSVRVPRFQDPNNCCDFSPIFSLSVSVTGFELSISGLRVKCYTFMPPGTDNNSQFWE